MGWPARMALGRQRRLVRPLMFVHCGANRCEKGLFANLIERSESFELVFYGVFEFGKAQSCPGTPECFISQAVLQGRKHQAGTVARVPALEIERRVTKVAGAALSASDRRSPNGSQTGRPGASGRSASSDLPAARLSAVDLDANLRAALERVVVSRTTIEIELGETVAGEAQNRVLIIPWTPPSLHRRREIIQGEGDQSSATRPMRSKARAFFIDALRDAHRWLDELTTSSNQTIEALAAREGKTERWIRRTLSLAFLCPTLVRAAIDSRLPRGFGAKRLMDLPMAWSHQWSALGLKAPAEG